MRNLILILLLSSPCLAGGPKYKYENPQLNDEMSNIYKDIPNVLKGNVRISSVTITTMTVTSSATITNLTVTNCTGCSSSSTSLTISTLTVTSSTTIKGTQTNDSAAVGNIGEIVESVNSSGSNYPATGTWGDLTSIALTAGDWDLNLFFMASQNAATITDVFNFGLSTVNGNSSSGLVLGSNQGYHFPTAAFPNITSGIDGYRVSTSTSPTYYVKYLGNYAAGTPVARCRISARRVR